MPAKRAGGKKLHKPLRFWTLSDPGVQERAELVPVFDKRGKLRRVLRRGGELALHQSRGFSIRFSARL